MNESLILPPDPRRTPKVMPKEAFAHLRTISLEEAAIILRISRNEALRRAKHNPETIPGLLMLKGRYRVRVTELDGYMGALPTCQKKLHPVTADTTYVRTNGTRQCKLCASTAQRRRRASGKQCRAGHAVINGSCPCS